MSLRLITLVAAISLISGPAVAAPDPRADDAVAAFSSLCLEMFLGNASNADPSRFDVSEVDAATRRQIKPDVQAKTLWSVEGKASGVMMLVHYEPTGMCVVEIAEADDKAVQEGVRALAQDAALKQGAAAVEQPLVRTPVQGLIASSAGWRLPSAKRDLLVMVTTVPEPKFMIQHVITVSFAR